MFQSVAILALISAFFYCVAMVAMKSWAELPSIGLALIIVAALLRSISPLDRLGPDARRRLGHRRRGRSCRGPAMPVSRPRFDPSQGPESPL